MRKTMWIMAWMFGCNGGDTDSDEPAPATTVRITYLSNAGVLIEDDTHAVLIDALSTNAPGWIQMEDTAFTALTQAAAPYDQVTAALATHNHGDHFSPEAVTSFLAGNAGATFIGPPQAASQLTAGTQISTLQPSRGQRETVELDGLRIDVLHLQHFDQFSFDFSEVENYGFLVHIGGLKLLHLGDVAYSDANLAPFDLVNEGIDVVMIPTFNTLLSADSAGVITSNIAPEHVVALHFQAGAVDEQSSMAADLFGADVFTTPMQQLRY